MFKHIFLASEDEVTASNKSLEPKHLETLAHAFGSVIPSESLSPAEVGGYLMLHRNDPLTAVSNAGHWASEIIAIKARGANVSAHSSNVSDADSSETSSAEVLEAAVGSDGSESSDE